MSRFFVSFLSLLLAAPYVAAQDASSTSPLSTTVRANPTRVEDNSVRSKPLFRRFNNFSPETQRAFAAEAALGTASLTITSVAHWAGTFTTSGVKYSYRMVGTSPASNVSTRVPTAIVPIRFVFDAYKDASGNKLAISPSSVLSAVKDSPNWVAAPYSTGQTQFADAVQRAEFFSTMGASWHTLLAAPRTLTTVTVEVTSGHGKVFKTASGATFAEVDETLFLNALNRVLPTLGLRSGEFPVAISRNILLYEKGNINNCCVLGFHTAFQTGGTSTAPVLQTFAWASWLSKGIFSNTDLVDVLAISHEISEWMDDPFVNNKTPAWEYPDNSGCGNDLETGDPVEVLDNLSNPVTVSGFTYHPQTEALLQWFSRQKPSTAIHGAYSYPDLSALKAPSAVCK